jgi:two-component system phosphate regulon sensor histidine kinase PhoR
LSLAALGLATVLTVATIYGSSLEKSRDDEVRIRLRTAAAATGELLADRWPSEPTQQALDLVSRSAKRMGVRLTLMSLDGSVLADSAQPDLSGVQSLENHADRREFIDAVRTGEGSARHLSVSLRKPFLYEAMRVDVRSKPVGVVRSSMDSTTLAADRAAVWRPIWIAGALSGLGVIAAAYSIASRVTNPLRSLAALSDALVAGQYDARFPPQSFDGDEFGQLARSLGEIGKQLAQRERQLRGASQTQATVLEGMTESVIAVDRADRIQFANGAAGRFLGFNPARVIGSTLLEAVRSHELRAIAHAALSSRELTAGELTWQRGAKRTFEVLATPLPGDPPPGVVLVLRDVSELKRLEEMRQQFIANVSHELKTPLSSIKAYTETLLSGAKNDPIHCQRFLERIDEQSNRLQQLIFDMLSLARIESGEGALDLVSVPVARVARRCFNDFEPQAAARHVSLSNLVDDPTIHVRADEEALWQILNNLVDNALKYTPPDGRVMIRCRREEPWAVIEVQDTGIGIAPEHHERLFERFYRVDKARSRELGGTGLGLSIVKHLSQAMGGSVSVKSRPDEGCTFIVRLPLAGGGPINCVLTLPS